MKRKPIAKFLLPKLNDVAVWWAVCAVWKRVTGSELEMLVNFAESPKHPLTIEFRSDGKYKPDKNRIETNLICRNSKLNPNLLIGLFHCEKHGIEIKTYTVNQN